jgi:hypothetical protein
MRAGSRHGLRGGPASTAAQLRWKSDRWRASGIRREDVGSSAMVSLPLKERMGELRRWQPHAHQGCSTTTAPSSSALHRYDDVPRSEGNARSKGGTESTTPSSVTPTGTSPHPGQPLRPVGSPSKNFILEIEPLTPAHFLKATTLAGLPLGHCPVRTPSANSTSCSSSRSTLS